MSTPELVDCHTHTHFSDGTGSFAQNVAAALRAGLSVLASTDHLTLPAELDPQGECSVLEKDLKMHHQAFLEVREHLEAGDFADWSGLDCGETPAPLELIYGFEADWYEGCEENIARWRGEASFLLGSIHFLDKQAIDYDKQMQIWDEWGPDKVWRTYVERWCKACSSSAKFDSMAHPDLVKLFSRSGYAPSIKLEPLWDAMAEAARNAGVHVELSTAGLRKPCQEFYPSAGLLQRFCKAGVPITIASDAHTPETIGWHIQEAYALAYEQGYRSIDVPCAEGGWRSISLSN